MNQIYVSTPGITTIKYSKKVGKILAISGFLLIIVSMFIAGSSLFFFLFAISIFMLITGYAYQVNNAYFTLDDRELCIYNLRGRKHKIYQYNSPTDVTVEGNKVYIQVNERKKKLPIEKLVIDPENWNSFMDRINQ